MTTLGNGTSTEYDYDTDPRYRLDTITHKKGANTLATIDYTDTARDNAGNPKSMTDWTGTWDYGYDDNNRLVSATPPNPVPDQPAGGDYGYDWVGNRLNPPTGTNHMVYNKVDQLTSWPGMHTYTYYGDGGLHDVKDASGTNVLRSFAYTPDGLLESASYNSRTLTNTWDGSKNRVSFIAGSTTHTFVYDPTAGIPAVIDEDGVYYVREPEGSLICRISGVNTSYYHFDALGSTRLLTDGDGDVTDKYAYDAYGSLISHDEYTGSVDQPYQYVGELGYYTHWQEPEFGLLQLGVRFYDAEVGRFTQRDRVHRDAISDYVYCNGRPMVHADPKGTLETPVGCIRNALAAAERIHDPTDGSQGDDKLAHCFFACRAARCFGILRFCPLFPITEDVIGRLIEKYWSNDDPEDANVQTLGIAASYTTKTCRQACRDVIQHLRNRTRRYRPQ